MKNHININLTNEVILNFRMFLNRSWETVLTLLKGRDYSSDEDSISDWLQANWELLVERKLLNCNGDLEIYGAGADNGQSSRFTTENSKDKFHIVLATSEAHLSVYDYLLDEYIFIDDFQFEEFVSMVDGYYKRCPPFDYALVTKPDGNECVFAVSDVKFVLEEM